MLVTNWLRGLWQIKYRRYQDRVNALLQEWENVCQTIVVVPPTDHSDFHRHVFRELNTKADSKANLGRISGKCSWLAEPSTRLFPYIRIYSDGSLKDGRCGGGFFAYGSDDQGEDDSHWHIIAWSAFTIHATSITAAELEASAGAVLFAASWLLHPGDWRRFLEDW